MIFCKKENKTNKSNLPPLIKGNIYKKSNSRDIYIYCKYKNILVNLETGEAWADKDYGHPLPDDKWIDVTDQYCVKEI